MRKIFFKKKGFTLVEMLVVIGIVALLSTMAVNSYLEYRKTALIDLNTDELISQINELRNRSIFRNESSEKIDQIKAELSGEGVMPIQENSSYCYGIYFINDGGVYKFYSFKQIFVKQKQFDNIEGWRYKGCGGFDPNSPEIVLQEIILDEQVSLVDIKNDELSLSALVLRFAPPKGKLELSNDADLSNFQDNFNDPNAIKALNFILRYGQLDDDRFKKTASLDLTTNNFFKDEETD